jgi:hypothetical protein
VPRLYRWLPKTNPGGVAGGTAGENTFDRIISTALTLQKFLTDNESPFIITTLEGVNDLGPNFFANGCKGAFASTKPAGNHVANEVCEAEGFVMICPSALKDLSDRLMIDQDPARPLAEICTPENRAKLDKVPVAGERGGFNFEVSGGPRGKQAAPPWRPKYRRTT